MTLSTLAIRHVMTDFESNSNLRTGAGLDMTRIFGHIILELQNLCRRGSGGFRVYC